MRIPLSDLDNQYPRKVKRDEDGYVSDMSTCDEFDREGQDNGLLNVIEDCIDYNKCAHFLAHAIHSFFLSL